MWRVVNKAQHTFLVTADGERLVQVHRAWDLSGALKVIQQRDAGTPSAKAAAAVAARLKKVPPLSHPLADSLLLQLSQQRHVGTYFSSRSTPGVPTDSTRPSIGIGIAIAWFLYSR